MGAPRAGKKTGMSRVVSNVNDSKGNIPRSIFGFEVIDYIGQGAGSSIYVVSHPLTHQLYALKHVVPTTEKDQRFVEQLENEYEVGQKVTHAGLRKSIEAKFVREGIFRKQVTEAALILELFDGQPLERKLPKSMAGLVDCFIQTAQALEALHGMGYVHCDLKPNNILRNSSRQVKVIDLGQACKVGTAKQRIQGTPDYIAPEQVKLEPVTAKTDVYNFGATLYWALCGKNFPTLFTLKKGENSFLLDAKIPTPREICPGVPEPVSNLVMECVRTNPAKRPELSDVIRRLEIAQHVIQREHKQQIAQLQAAGA